MITVLAAAFLLQVTIDQPALQKLEESIRVAKTLNVKFTLVGTGTNQSRFTGTGILLLKQGNKLKLSITEEVKEGSGRSVKLWSDGTQMQAEYHNPQARTTGKMPPSDCDADLSEQFLAGFSLAGIGGLLLWDPVEKGFLGQAILFRLPPQSDWKSTLKRQDVPEIGKDLSLSYSIRLKASASESDARAKVTVWLDPKSGALKKRLFKTEDFTVEENYDTVALGEEISDELFKLP